MLEQLVAETTDCDFKSAVERDKPKSWLKSVSAFANTYGGLVGDSGTLTNAGALFADEALIRHSRVFCTRWTGLHKESPTDDAEISGSLLTLLREGEAFVRRHNILSWKKTPNSRLNYRCYAERAVTESLVNALVHRSYLDLGSEVHVDIYDNRLTISSPGAMIKGPLPKDVLNSSIESRRRNPVICDVFSRLNLMERRGTGLQEICRATMAEDAFRPEYMPQFEEEGDVFRVTLWNMKYESDGEKVHAGLPEINELSPKERAALDFIETSVRPTSTDTAVALKMSKSGAIKLLNRLINYGLVKRMGNNRSTFYTLANR